MIVIMKPTYYTYCCLSDEADFVKLIAYCRKLKKRYDHADYHFTTLPLGQNPLLDEPNTTINGSIMKPVPTHDGKQLMYTMMSAPLGSQQVYNNIDE